MMKVGIFGATGPTGIHATQQTLDKGFNVVALVRNPDKLNIEHENLQKFKVDIMDPETMAPHMKDCSVVISCLGVPRRGLSNFWEQVTFYSDSIKSIVNAMKIAEVKSIICITAWSTENRPGNPVVFEYIVKPIFIGRVLIDMQRMEQYLMNDDDCKDLNYTIVRPGILKNGKSTDKTLKIAEDGFGIKEFWGYERITRGDLARFIVTNCLENQEHKRRGVAIGT